LQLLALAILQTGVLVKCRSFFLKQGGALSQ